MKRQIISALSKSSGNHEIDNCERPESRTDSFGVARNALNAIGCLQKR